MEDFINQLYINLHVNNPNQLEIAYLAKRLNLNIYYGRTGLILDNNIVIRISNKQREWQLFGHEVGHYLRHEGNHLPMYPLFRDLQENQANYFAYHFCVPTFMLRELKEISIQSISETFKVDYAFASRRLEMYQSKFIYEGIAYNG